MADDPKYDFNWFNQPAVKSMARIKRKPEGWQSTTPGQAGDIAQKYGTDNQAFSEDTGGMVPNPNIQPAPIPGVSPVATTPVPTDLNELPGTNPHTGGPVAGLDEWMASGGSLHAFHNMQVKAGLRPSIDARTTPSPTEGMASNTDIRSGWGWEPATQSGSQGSALIASGGSAGDPARIQANAQAAQAQARRMAEQQARLNASRAAISQSNPNGSVQ